MRGSNTCELVSFFFCLFKKQIIIWSQWWWFFSASEAEWVQTLVELSSEPFCVCVAFCCVPVLLLFFTILLSLFSHYVLLGVQELRRSCFQCAWYVLACFLFSLSWSLSPSLELSLFSFFCSFSEGGCSLSYRGGGRRGGCADERFGLWTSGALSRPAGAHASTFLLSSRLSLICAFCQPCILRFFRLPLTSSSLTWMSGVNLVLMRVCVCVCVFFFFVLVCLSLACSCCTGMRWRKGHKARLCRSDPLRSGESYSSLTKLCCVMLWHRPIFRWLCKQFKPSEGTATSMNTPRVGCWGMQNCTKSAPEQGLLEEWEEAIKFLPF